MTFIQSWEDFARAADKLYLQNPSKVRYCLKYNHKNGLVSLKITDDVVCLQYKTEIQQDIKKIEKYTNNLMNHMAPKK